MTDRVTIDAVVAGMEANDDTIRDAIKALAHTETFRVK